MWNTFFKQSQFPHRTSFQTTTNNSSSTRCRTTLHSSSNRDNIISSRRKDIHNKAIRRAETTTRHNNIRPIQPTNCSFSSSKTSLFPCAIGQNFSFYPNFSILTSRNFKIWSRELLFYRNFAPKFITGISFFLKFLQPIIGFSPEIINFSNPKNRQYCIFYIKNTINQSGTLEKSGRSSEIRK